MRKINTIVFFLAFGILITLFFYACKSDTSTEEVVVGIIKFVRHPALDETERGLIEEIESNEISDSLNIRFEQHVVDANVQRASTAAEVLTQREVDLIVAIATPAAQAVSNISSNIPLVYTAVSDPEGAGIIPSDRTTGIKNVGPSIIQTALDRILLWFPDTRIIGTVYNPSEQNSVYVQNILSDITSSYDLNLVQIPVRQSSEVSQAIQSLVQRVDILYSANDNTFNSAISPAVEISLSSGVPLFLGDLSTISSGALGAIGLDYYDMGKRTGKIVAKILSGTDVSNIAPSGPPEASFWINADIANEMRIAIPDTIFSVADSVIRKE